MALRSKFPCTGCAAAFLLCTLCGCGGSNSSTNQGVGVTTPIQPTPTTFPTGQAVYSGYMTLNFTNNLSPTTTIGDTVITVNFATNGGIFTGVADNFTLPSNEALTGRIFLTAGQITQGIANGPIELDSGLSGTLSGTSLQTTLFTGTMSGEFQAGGFDVLTGTTQGNTTTSTGSNGFSGSFSSAKQ